MTSGSTARSEGGPADIDAPPAYVLGAEGCPPHSFSPPGPPNRVSVDALLAAGPLPLPQHVFLDLAGRGLGKVSELYPLRALEVRDPLAAVGDDLLGRRRPAGPERHERLRHLAPGLVRRGDDRALQDGRVGRDRLLDLDRADVLAARDDDVLHPVAQLDGAVRVHDGHVPRMKPAAAERLRGRVGLLEVAPHDRIAAAEHLAHRPAVRGDVAHAVVDDALAAGQYVRDPLARLEPGALLEAQPLETRWAYVQRAGPVGLREPVEVLQHEVEVRHLRDERGRGRRAARHGA